MVGSRGQSGGFAAASGDYDNLWGELLTLATETTMQASATEACTFSLLRFNVVSGGSGTNDLRFRKNTANGNQLATGTGTGIKEDSSNIDTLAAADLFNLAYTDDGTNSFVAWISGLVEFSSGYGAFVASNGNTIHDVESATRYISLTGATQADGTATEANAAFKARGYTTFEALQVRATTNARTNTSTFKNRINGADGTGSCSFSAGATGLVVSSGLGDAIADGNTICASITLGTGVEDLTELEDRNG